MSETTTAPPAPKPNRYPGACWFCGAKVPAGAGTYDGSVRHLPGRCNRKTKTYRDTIATARMRAYREEVERMWTAAGYSRYIPQYAYHSVQVTGNGLTVLIGGERTPDRHAMGVEIGIEIYRGGGLIGKHDRPAKPETGDYYGDWLTAEAATIATIDSYRTDTGEQS